MGERMTIARSFAGLAMVIFGVLLNGTGPSKADENEIRRFFAAQGCAIGPTTVSRAEGNGLDRGLIDAYARQARLAAGSVNTGDWVVLPSSLCTIRLPVTTSELKLSDPGLAQSISAIDAYAADGDVGCFLDPEKLLAALQQSRRWDEEKANREYLRFLSASLVAGKLSFHSPDPLRTPPGFVVLTDECLRIPQLAQIRRSQQLLATHFDALIRADAAGDSFCNDRMSPSFSFPDVFKRITGEQSPNAMIGFEISIIAIGAGWFDNTSARRKGDPRPPLCRYR
jgi:hypothetical protein